MQLTPIFTTPSRILSKAALCAMACLSAGTLWAKDVFLAGLSETGTNWALFDVSKNMLKPGGEDLFDDSLMCSFATSANMLAYQQWRNISGFPTAMPKGNQAIYNDMQTVYGNRESSMDAVLGAFQNNEVASYPRRYYENELRDYAFCVWVRRNNAWPYTSQVSSDEVIPGLYQDMNLSSILDWAFEHGAAMGVNLQPYYDMGTDPHAITLWGARYNDYDNSVTGLFYTDSDDTESSLQMTERVGIRMTSAIGYDEDGSLWCELDNNLRYKIYSITLLNPEAFYVIPEPSAFGLLAGGFALALLVARRRRRSGC